MNLTQILSLVLFALPPFHIAQLARLILSAIAAKQAILEMYVKFVLMDTINRTPILLLANYAHQR